MKTALALADDDDDDDDEGSQHAQIDICSWWFFFDF